MADVTITYKGNSIATMSASGTKTLLTEGKYCEDDITVDYTAPTPSAGSATTPATTITANPTITVSTSGLITATASTSQSITPTVVAGYVSAGTAGTVSVSGSNTKQLTAKAAATYTPTTADQTIASGQYLMGAQTRKGDANLLAENIKKDVSIFSIVGSYEGGGGGSTLTVVIDNMGEIYYVDASGTYQHISSSSSATFSAPEHSLIAFLTDAAMISPGCENITTRASVALGSRANYRYAIMFQVESD